MVDNVVVTAFFLNISNGATVSFLGVFVFWDAVTLASATTTALMTRSRANTKGKLSLKS